MRKKGPWTWDPKNGLYEWGVGVQEFPSLAQLKEIIISIDFPLIYSVQMFLFFGVKKSNVFHPFQSLCCYIKS